jgi:hypothetical protein
VAAKHGLGKAINVELMVVSVETKMKTLLRSELQHQPKYLGRLPSTSFCCLFLGWLRVCPRIVVSIVCVNTTRHKELPRISSLYCQISRKQTGMAETMPAWVQSKLEGDAAFKAQEYHSAANFYSTSLQGLVSSGPNISWDTVMEQKKLYSNRSLANYRLEEYDQAVADVRYNFSTGLSTECMQAKYLFLRNRLLW